MFYFQALQHKLVDSLANENKKLKLINNTFRKFVPQQFLDKIAKNDKFNLIIKGSTRSGKDYHSMHFINKYKHVFFILKKSIIGTVFF